MKKYLKDNGPVSYIAAFLIIFTAVFILFRKLFFGEVIATNDASTNDLLFFMFPIRAIYGEALKAGEILQWTPLIYSGFPVLAEGQAGFLYPVNLVLCYLLDPFQAMNFFLIFHALVMGYGVFLFTSKITGSSWCSVPAGVAAAICGSLIAGHARHMNSFAVISLTPWLFLAAEIYLRKFKISAAMMFGCILGLMLLIGHPQYSFIGGFLAFLYILMRIYFMTKEKDYKPPSRTALSRTGARGSSVSIGERLGMKLLLFAVVSVVIALAISYAQIRDTMQLASLSQRGEGVTSEFTGMGSLFWNGFMTFIYPYHWGNAGNNTYEIQHIYMFWEVFHYISLVALALALFAVYSKWKSSNYVKILTILAVLSYLLALGNNLPLYRIFSFVPFVKSFRFPVRWLLGTEISLLALSGFGVMALVQKFTFVKEPDKKKKGPKSPPKKENSFGAFLLNYPYAPGFIIAALVIIDIYAVAGRQVATADPKVWFDSSASVTKYNTSNEFRRTFALGNVEFFLDAYNKSSGWEGNKSLYTLGTKLLPPNVSAYYHIPTISGYTQLVPVYVVEVWGDALTPGVIRKVAMLKDKQTLTLHPPFSKLAAMWSVKDFMCIWNLEKPFELKWDSAGVKKYELPEIMPHAWVVKEGAPVSADYPARTAEMMLDLRFTPSTIALVHGNAPQMPANSENGKVEILEYKNHSVKMRALSPGLVVLSDTWYPRWKAKVDGQDAQIYRVNNMMRGVVSPRPGAEIEMYYDDGNVKLFLIISLLVITVCIGYTVFSSFTRRHSPIDGRTL